MNLNKYQSEFTNLGFTKISNVLSEKDILKINSVILSFLLKKEVNEKKLSNCFNLFNKFFLKKKTNTQLFEIQKKIYNYLDNSGILNEILLSTKIYEFLTKIIGPDLEYKKSNEFIINTSANQKDNYLYKNFIKKFGQEHQLILF